MRVLGGEVHVWRADLVMPAGGLEPLATTLSATERERASRLSNRRAGERFVIARGILRQLLGEYLGVEAGDVRLHYEAHGRPCLAAPAPVDFNVSHAANQALFAFTDVGRLGVDVEHVRPLANSGRIARRAFGENELAEWLALPENERLHGFFERWTRVEAHAKMLGHGVWRLLAEREKHPLPPAHFYPVEIASGYVATLAVQKPISAVRVRDYPG